MRTKRPMLPGRDDKAEAALPLAQPGTLLVIDDHPLVRSALAQLLRRLVSDAQVLEAGTLGQACWMLDARLDGSAPGGAPDLILCDLALPDTSGFMAISALVSRYPSIPVLAVSGSADFDGAEGALAAGARAYVAKSAPVRQLSAAVRKILGPTRSQTPIPVAAERGTLSSRAAQVAVLCAAGHRNKVIGDILNITENTVRVHVSRLLRFYRLSSRRELAQVVKQLGLDRSVQVPLADRQTVVQRAAARRARRKPSLPTEDTS